MADLAAFSIVAALVLLAGIGIYRFLRVLPYLDRGDD